MQDALDDTALRKDIKKFKQLLQSLNEPKKMSAKDSSNFVNRPRAIYHASKSDSSEEEKK